MNHNRIHSPRGSAILTVLIFTVVLCVLAGSIITYVISERRLNTRLQRQQEASLAAEALTEYGVSQIRQKFLSRSNVTLGATGTDAVVLPPASFWTGGNVQTSSLELKAGTVTNMATGASSLYFIDPADPANASDPNKNQWVMSCQVPIIAKATVLGNGTGGTVTACSLQKLGVRFIPLFAHAVFYNMDLEIFPGPDMQIVGPVQVNGSAFLSSKGGSWGLLFRDSVNITGNLYHAWKTTSASSHGTGNESMGNSAVSFMSPSKDASGNTIYTPVSMYDSGSAKWKDSMMGALGNSGTLGVADATQNDPAFPAYASARWGGMLSTGQTGAMPYNPPAIGTYSASTATTAAADNSVNSARQLIEPPNWPTATDPQKAAKNEVELGKFANNAGLYIQVDPVAKSISYMARSKNSTTPTKTFTTVPTDMVKFIPYAYNTSTSKVTGGLYDRRRSVGTNLVEIDVSKLKAAVTEMATPTNPANRIQGVNYGTTTATTLQPSDWTGIVYIEVKGDPTTNLDGSTNAAANAAATSTAVRLVKGGSLPSYGTANPGLTVATNAPMYVLGNYNADGTITTNADMTKSSACLAEANEVPAALVADAITVLSPGWSDANSKAGTNAATATSEISAAMLMGLTPTNNNGNGVSSGGLHNFPRFLENWSGKAVWIRGSLVALFESRVAKEPWSTGYYSPPERDWGFNSQFRAGIFPPGTPKVVAFRRLQYTSITESEYNSLKSSYGW